MTALRLLHVDPERGFSGGETQVLALVRELAARGHFVRIPHPARGESVVEASRFRLSRTPARTDAPAPTFGDSTQWVLESVLGYDDERIAELAIAGALE